MTKLKVLDLFSGIGGFSLGLERTGGFETVAFCEIEPFCQKVLNKHWPKVPIYDDVTKLTGSRLAADGITGIDIITGGFPCQDISTSGSGEGLAGERSGLWSEIARLVSEIRPKFAIVENSPNLLSGDRGRWFGKVLGDLAEVGFDAEWDIIGARDIGAPHKRERIWITAYPFSFGQSKPRGYLNALSAAPEAYREADSLIGHVQGSMLPYVCKRHDGVSSKLVLGGLKGLGNAVVPQIPELLGHAILSSIQQEEAHKAGQQSQGQCKQELENGHVHTR
jgi:DNA (cytosine-5)-methyltransferase 1